MYGNYYDYGNSGVGDVRSTIEGIMADTRDAVSQLGAGSVYDDVAGGMADRLSSVGVGNVSDFLADAYTPFIPAATPSYADFMGGADVPTQIQNNINAVNTAYEAGTAARMEEFQNLLKEVRAFSYGTPDTEGYTPGSDIDKDGLGGPAQPEIKALLPKFKDRNDNKTQESLDKYKELFGNKFSFGEYNDLLDAGVGAERIKENVMKYNQAGGKVGSRVFDAFGYDLVDPNEETVQGPYVSNWDGRLVVPKDDENSLFPGAAGFSFY